MGIKANLKPAKLHVGDLKSDLISFENGNPFLRIRPPIQYGFRLYYAWSQAI